MSTAEANHDGPLTPDRRSRRVALATIGPERVAGLDVILRRARLSDGPAWRRARKGEDRLRAAFGDDDSLTAWVDHVLQQRAATRAGDMLPFVVVTVGGDLLGECLFTMDRRSGAAELSLWTIGAAPSSIAVWTTARAILRLHELPHHVPWVVAPVAVTNPGPNHLFELAGFEPASTARELRPHDGAPADHVIWRLENSPATRDRLRALLDDL